MIDLAVTLQIVATSVTVYGVRKLYLDTSLVFRSKAREEYKFAKEFLSDGVADSGLHPFLREKGCQAITGEENVNPEHIECVLSLRHPAQGLREYAYGKKYLESEYAHDNRYVDNLNRIGAVSLVFRKQYQKKWIRKAIAFGYFALYMIPVTSVMWIVSFAKRILPNPHEQLVFIGLWIPAVALLGWHFLSRGRQISSAEALIRRIENDSIVRDHIRLRENTRDATSV